MSVVEAIEASQRLCDRGDLGAATRALDPFIGDRLADLQRGAVAAEAVLLDGADPGVVESILTPHLDEGRALDLIGLGHFHSAVTTGAHSLSEAVGEFTSASRLTFDSKCWKVASMLHIGVAQQALGSHDIAEMYLRDAHRQAEGCPAEQALAALHLGLDSLARGDSDSGIRLIEVALDIRRFRSIDVRVPETLVILAEAIEETRPEEAEKLAGEAVDLGRALGVRRPLALALTTSGRLRHRRRELEEARAIADRTGDAKLREKLLGMLESDGEN